MTQRPHPVMQRALDAVLRRFAVPAVVALTMGIVPASAPAQNVERSGKEVVEASCFACHGSGASGAPKIGDKNAWAKRA